MPPRVELATEGHGIAERRHLKQRLDFGAVRAKGEAHVAVERAADRAAREDARRDRRGLDDPNAIREPGARPLESGQRDKDASERR